MKRLSLILIFSAFLLLPHQLVKADYVLPYPSYLPGNKLYLLSRLLDELEGYWYWGNIAQVKYHLKLTDKYLVEAKTLFEYNQYLLAVKALQRSDEQFKLIPLYIDRVTQEGKDVSQLKKVVLEAADKHVATLDKLKLEIPQSFKWAPEKDKPTSLNLGQILTTSIEIRQSIR